MTISNVDSLEHISRAGRAGVTLTQWLLAAWGLWIVLWFLTECIAPALFGRPILPGVRLPWRERKTPPR